MTEKVQLKQLTIIFFFLFLFFSLNAEEIPENIPRLARERVIVQEKQNHEFDVIVEYYLEGKFPEPLDIAFPATYWYPYKKFVQEFHGKNIPVTYQEAGEGKYYSFKEVNYPALYYGTLPAAEGNAHFMRSLYSFTAPELSTGTKDDLPAGYYLEYILRTGSGWGGPVDNLIVEVRFENSKCSSIYVLEDSFQGNCVSQKLWRFSADNVVLDRDVRLVIQKLP